MSEIFVSSMQHTSQTRKTACTHEQKTTDQKDQGKRRKRRKEEKKEIGKQEKEKIENQYVLKYFASQTRQTACTHEQKKTDQKEQGKRRKRRKEEKKEIGIQEKDKIENQYVLK